MALPVKHRSYTESSPLLKSYEEVSESPVGSDEEDPLSIEERAEYVFEKNCIEREKSQFYIDCERILKLSDDPLEIAQTAGYLARLCCEKGKVERDHGCRLEAKTKSPEEYSEVEHHFKEAERQFKLAKDYYELGFKTCNTYRALIVDFLDFLLENQKFDRALVVCDEAIQSNPDFARLSQDRIKIQSSFFEQRAKLVFAEGYKEKDRAKFCEDCKSILATSKDPLEKAQIAGYLARLCCEKGKVERDYGYRLESFPKKEPPEEYSESEKVNCYLKEAERQFQLARKYYDHSFKHLQEIDCSQDRIKTRSFLFDAWIQFVFEGGSKEEDWSKFYGDCKSALATAKGPSEKIQVIGYLASLCDKNCKAKRNWKNYEKTTNYFYGLKPPEDSQEEENPKETRDSQEINKDFEEAEQQFKLAEKHFEEGFQICLACPVCDICQKFILDFLAFLQKAKKFHYALEVCNKAIQCKPKIYHLFQERAKIYGSLLQWRSALTNATIFLGFTGIFEKERVLAIDMCDLAADCCMELGHPNEACKHLEKACKFDLKEPRKKRRLNRISNIKKRIIL